MSFHGGEKAMNSTYHHLKNTKKEEGQKELLERNLEAHRSRRWVTNSIYAISLLVLVLCFYFHVPQAAIITLILFLICVTSEILYRALDKKIELRLKRIKQEKRKIIFKGNKF
jgi:Mn2+/Fe2+ NRAMP family transporter